MSSYMQKLHFVELLISITHQHEQRDMAILLMQDIGMLKTAQITLQSETHYIHKSLANSGLFCNHV